MTFNSKRVELKEPSFLLCILRKIAPGLLIGAFAGVAIGLLSTHAPTTLRWVAVVGAALFAAVSVLYFYWASCPNPEGGYQWSISERAGILVSGFAALVMGAKLAFSSALPGSTWFYFFGACFLAFIVRPFLAFVGTRNSNSEQEGADRPPTVP